MTKTVILFRHSVCCIYDDGTHRIQDFFPLIVHSDSSNPLFNSLLKLIVSKSKM